MAERGERLVAGDAERFAELTHRRHSQGNGEIGLIVAPDVADHAGNDLESGVEHEAADADDELSGARESHRQQPECVDGGARHQQQRDQERHHRKCHWDDRCRAPHRAGERPDADQRRRDPAVGQPPTPRVRRVRAGAR